MLLRRFTENVLHRNVFPSMVYRLTLQVSGPGTPLKYPLAVYLYLYILCLYVYSLYAESNIFIYKFVLFYPVWNIFDFNFTQL